MNLWEFMDNGGLFYKNNEVNFLVGKQVKLNYAKITCLKCVITHWNYVFSLVCLWAVVLLHCNVFESGLLVSSRDRVKWEKEILISEIKEIEDILNLDSKWTVSKKEIAKCYLYIFWD